MPTTTPRSRAAAINAKCKECVYDPYARGTWREQVADCRGVNCPLYDFRPVPRDAVKDGRIDQEAVALIHMKIAR